MLGSDWGTVSLVMMLVLFLLGAVASIVAMHRENAANLLAHTFSCLGGICGLAASLYVLLGKSEIILSGWHLLPPIQVVFHVDVLSAFFLLIISVLAVAVSIYSVGYVTEYYGKKNIGLLGGGINIFLLSMAAVVTVDNAFVFLVAWELMSLVSFFLVMFQHEKTTVRTAGYVYIVMTHAGTVFIILSFLTLYLYTDSFSFAVFHLMGSQLPANVQSIVFLLALVGFSTKAGIVPLHIWLPRAHPAAPGNISALMSAVMLKTALYGLLRVCFDFLDGGYAWWGVVVLVAGMLSSLYGILQGVTDNDLKRFLAYSSSENMGIIYMGLGACLLFHAGSYSVLAALAMTALLYHALNHAVFKGLLFMGAGAVIYATHTGNINELGGLIRRMPTTALFFLVGGVSMAALPPFNGFISEWATFQSLLRMGLEMDNPMWRILGILAAAVLGMVGALAAGGVVKHFGTAFLAMPRSEYAKKAVEVPLAMQAGMGLLAVFTLLLGIFPGVVFNAVAKITSYFLQEHVNVETIWSMPRIGQNGNSVSIILLLLISLLFFLTGMLVLRNMFGKPRVELGETWNCGRNIDSAMEYTGTSYSRPISIIFKYFLGIRTTMEIHGEYAYYPKKISHDASPMPLIENKVYKPMVMLTLAAANKIRIIQNGNLQSYLLYMVIALIVALLWSRRLLF